jgi:hypothetical protein
MTKAQHDSTVFGWDCCACMLTCALLLLLLLLLQVNDQLLVQPQAVLLSMVRALHVVRGVLQEVRPEADGAVFFVML